MVEINIEINIEEEKWLSTLPSVEEIIKKATIIALHESGVTQSTKSIEVSVLLTNDKFIKNLNRDYLNKDKATNVLSFPLEDFSAGKYEDIGEDIAIGDIIFALETILKEALEQNKSLENHLTHLAIHGALHLLGFDHDDDGDAQIMEALEIKILNKMAIENPY